MSKSFRVNFSSQPNMFDVQFYQYEGDDLMPIQSECYSFDRRQLIKLRDCLDDHIGDCKTYRNWPPNDIYEMKRVMLELEDRLKQITSPN